METIFKKSGWLITQPREYKEIALDEKPFRDAQMAWDNEHKEEVFWSVPSYNSLSLSDDDVEGLPEKCRNQKFTDDPIEVIIEIKI